MAPTITRWTPNPSTMAVTIAPRTSTNQENRSPVIVAASPLSRLAALSAWNRFLARSSWLKTRVMRTVARVSCTTEAKAPSRFRSARERSSAREPYTDRATNRMGTAATNTKVSRQSSQRSTAPMPMTKITLCRISATDSVMASFRPLTSLVTRVIRSPADRRLWNWSDTRWMWSNRAVRRSNTTVRPARLR